LFQPLGSSGGFRLRNAGQFEPAKTGFQSAFRLFSEKVKRRNVRQPEQNRRFSIENWQVRVNCTNLIAIWVQPAILRDLSLGLSSGRAVLRLSRRTTFPACAQNR